MSIAMLRTLLAVHDLGSFSAAADAVNVTQAAVSQQMRVLERQWAVALFDRSRRPPEMTPMGRVIAQRARDVVAGYDALVPSAVVDGGVVGECRLGAVPTSLAGLVPLAAQALSHDEPRLRLSIVSGLTHKLITEVRHGRLDLALVSRPRVLDDGLGWHPVADETLELIAPPECAGESVATLLRDRSFIRFARDAIVGELTEAWLQTHGIVVRERMVVEELQATVHLVFSTRSVAIVPRQCVETLHPVPVCRLALGADAPVRQLGLVSSAACPDALVAAVSRAMHHAVGIGHFDAS
ncbi:MAG: LysR family transcriptional regulator [Pseudomonadota bacterium]